MKEILIIASVIAVSIYYFRRNNKTCVFQIEINKKCHNVLINFLNSLENDKEFYERLEEYEQLETKANEIRSKHSYSSMLFSLKPLKYEYWFTDEEIEFMNLSFK
jgi:hypothetical protein